jgi:hypothetical protein
MDFFMEAIIDSVGILIIAVALGFYFNSDRYKKTMKRRDEKRRKNTEKLFLNDGMGSSNFPNYTPHPLPNHTS